MIYVVVTGPNRKEFKKIRDALEYKSPESRLYEMDAFGNMVPLGTEDIDKRMKEISLQTGQSVDQIRTYIENNNLIASIKDELRSSKTIDFLMKEAKIDEK